MISGTLALIIFQLLGTPMSGATTTGGRFVELQSATGARGDGHPATFPGASSFIGDTVPIDGFVLGRIVSYLKSEGPEEVEAWLGSLQEIVVAQTIAQTSHVRYDDVLRCWSEQGLG